MFVMTYSQARQNFSSFLDQAKKDGEAIVTRSDGTKFKVIPFEEEKTDTSPFSELAAFSSQINSNLRDFSIKDILLMMKEEEDLRTDNIIRAGNINLMGYFGILNN